MISLKENLRQRGITPYFISKSLGINRRHIYHFLDGHRNKIGKATRRKIKEYFISIGLIDPPKPRKAPQCRNCGTQYPTRKIISVHAAVETGPVVRIDSLATGQSTNSQSIMQFQTADKKVA